MLQVTFRGCVPAKAAEILQKSFRDSDIIARVGGDEFVVLFPNTGSYSSQIALSRFRANINETNEKEGLNLSFSIGIAKFRPNENISLEDILDEADKNRYDEKNTKKKYGRGERI
ncbi:MAG TPA: GGDEF domain-containing protein [Deltaproteobacteria bacterium]|nr:GGDEF domain-containing protein [Deltaproteobacteria bacterium]